MAVVQISRIQIRRGRKGSGTSLPQLASGELAWAIDTQELYIGNGAVSEGSPAVGNTKILTQKDLTDRNAFLDLLTYTYKSDDPTIYTGDFTPRSVQNRLDDRANTTNFGAIGNDIIDDSIALQRAIDQLFLNENIKSSVQSADGAKTRVILEIPPGKYKITQTLLIPSYATIVGAGIDKTIIHYTGTGTAIQFINDTSNIGSASNINSTLYTNQPRFINISNLTIISDTTDQTCLQLDCVRNSTFENLNIQGAQTSSYNVNSKGIVLNALSSLVTTKDNIFKNLTIIGFSHAVYAKKDVLNNLFDTGVIGTQDLNAVSYGFNLGDAADGASIGQEYGPRSTRIENFKFLNVKRNGVYLYRGSDNSVSNCIFENVGNDGNNSTPLYAQIYFRTYGNYVHNLKTNRDDTLSLPNVDAIYVPIVAGHGRHSLDVIKYTTLGYTGAYEQLFRLPLNTDAYGVPTGIIAYNIEYTYQSTEYAFSRRGVITIIADFENSDIQLSDEYDYVGTGTSEDSLRLDFTAMFLDEIGDPFTGAVGQVPSTLCINFINTLSSDFGTFIYTYTSIF